jgi:DNA-binding transcriptional LysR family regulator
VSLISRNSRGHTLTDVGAEYYKRCLRIIAELDAADALVHDADTTPSGTLRMTAPGVVVRLLLAEVIADFLQQHPLVTIDLLQTDRFLDVVGEGLDLAIRGGKLSDSTLIAVNLHANPRVTVATPSYLEQQGIPQHPDDLTDHNCLVETALRQGNLWSFHHADGDASVRVGGAFRCNELDSIFPVLLAHQGIAVIPAWMAKPYLSEGRLERILTAYEPPAVPMQAVYPKTERVPARVRAFVDFLRERIRESPLFAD